MNSFEPGVTWWWSSRFVVAILGCWAFLNMSTQLMLVESAFRCMLNHTKIGDNALYSSGTANRSWDCSRVFDGQVITMQPKTGTFEWNTVTQNTVAEAALWGFTISALASGFAATRYGGRSTLAVGHFLMAFASVMSPIAANVSMGFLIFMQFLVGLGAGTTLPSMHVLWKHWAPPSERTRLPAISFTGIPLGVLMADSLGGLICDISVTKLDWPSMFFIHGSLCVLWFMLWVLLVADTPEKSSRALEEEKLYLAEQLDCDGSRNKGFPRLRCLRLIQSLPFIALVQSFVVGELGFFVLSVYVPRFFRTTMEFNVHVYGQGVFFGIPFLVMAFAIVPVSAFADYLRNRGKPSNKAVRKILDGLGKSGVAWMLLGIGFLDCHSWKVALTLWTIAFVFQGMQYSGHMVNHLDIAPRYAGLLMGLTACFGGATHVHAKEEFQSVIFTTCAMLTISTIIFSLLASGDVQSWNIDDILSKVRGSLHSEHAALQANMSKAGTLSDDYGASNRGAMRPSEMGSGSDSELSYDSQPEGDSDPSPSQPRQWADLRIRSVASQRSEDEKVPIGVPAVPSRSRSNTMERIANRNKSKPNTPDPSRRQSRESGLDTVNNNTPSFRVSQPDTQAEAGSEPLITLPVQGPHHPAGRHPGAKSNNGWQDVLVKELGQTEGSLVDGSSIPKKPARLKADLIDLGSSEDRDDSGMATEASATSSNFNGADDRAWRADLLKDIEFDQVSPQWMEQAHPPPGALDELLELGASSSNLCVEGAAALPGPAPTRTRGPPRGEGSKDPEQRGPVRRQPHVPHLSSMGDSPLSEHSSPGTEVPRPPSDLDNIEDILDAETSIPLESDGEPLVTRI